MHPSSPARLDDVGRYASGRVVLVELRDRFAAALDARPNAPSDVLADELARIALRTVGVFVARTADR